MAEDFVMVMPAPGGPEGFERRAVDPGRPGPGDVLVRHRAVGLNFLDVCARASLTACRPTLFHYIAETGARS
jgi:NADPH:quinone reductase